MRGGGGGGKLLIDKHGACRHDGDSTLVPQQVREVQKMHRCNDLSLGRIKENYLKTSTSNLYHRKRAF